MRALLDTNVLVSAILFRGPSRRLLDAALRGTFDLVTSPALLDELEELLGRKFGFSAAAAAQTRSEIEAVAQVVEPREVPRVCRDPDDDQVLAAAAEAAAGWIVTGDKDLIVLDPHNAIRIVPPSSFEARLAGEV